MSNESVKTLVFPEGGTTNNDALLLSAMNGGGFGNMNSPFWAIILLAFLRNGFGWGNGENNSQLSAIQEQLNTNHGQTLLMDAIKGNSGAIHELATTIGCNHNAVTAAINGVQAAICNVGNQVGMGTAQVINAVNSGNCSVAQAVKDCCCQTQQNIITQGYENRINNLQQSQLIQNGFSQVGYASAEQTCAIKQNATDNTSRVLAKLDAIEDDRKNREINQLTAALTAANSRAERAAELAPIYKHLNDIECKLPSTTTIPYSPVVGVPSCVAYNAALYGLGYGGFPYGQQGNVFS